MDNALIAGRARGLSILVDSRISHIDVGEKMSQGFRSKVKCDKSLGRANGQRSRHEFIR